MYKSHFLSEKFLILEFPKGDNIENVEQALNKESNPCFIFDALNKRKKALLWIALF